jgi:hypothetical protein
VLWLKVKGFLATMGHAHCGPPYTREEMSIDHKTYMTIMIGHTLAKLFGRVMEIELNGYMETMNL